MVPSVSLANKLKSLIGRLMKDKPDVNLDRSALTFRVVTEKPEVVTTFRVYKHGENEYELGCRIAPYRTQYSTPQDALDNALALTNASQKVGVSLIDIEKFLGSWVEP